MRRCPGDGEATSGVACKESDWGVRELVVLYRGMFALCRRRVIGLPEPPLLLEKPIRPDACPAHGLELLSVEGSLSSLQSKRR